MRQPQDPTEPVYEPEQNPDVPVRPIPPPKGRGAAANPANRFDPLALEELTEVDVEPVPGSAPRTRVFRDASRTLITTNRSPDVGFSASLNPYRGCEHGCAYCYARPTHEYLGLSAGLDFETQLFAKTDAPRLLRETFLRPRWKPTVLGMSGVTDPYQPVERGLRITRGCLEVLAEFRNPVAVITKNHLVTRDTDLLAELAAVDAGTVFVSITTLDESLRGDLEPRTSTAARRLDAIRRLSDAGVPTGVLVGPVIPGLTESELPDILRAAAEAGATQSSYIVLRLPYGVADLFSEWLERHVPLRKERVLNRVRSLRGGRLNDPRFGSRMRGEGVFAGEIRALYDIGVRRAGLAGRRFDLNRNAFRRPGAQLDFLQDLEHPS